MKKALMIIYYYPPVAGGGVQRSAKFVKYLPEFGWEPFVLTVKSGYDYYSDNSLEKDVAQNHHVFRTTSFEPMKTVRKWLKKHSDNSREIRDGKEIRPVRVKKPWLLVIKESIFIPDAEIGWLPFAVWRGWRIMRRHQIDLIYSTSCPYTDHLIAWCLQKLTGKPWLADFRDPWSLHLKAPQFAWRKFWDRTLEKLVLQSAHKIVTVTSLIARDFKKIYPPADYSIITNGFDETDFQISTGDEFKIEKFNITYTGILYRERSPKFLFEAVAALLTEHPELRDQMRIRLVGQLDNPGEVDNHNLLVSLKLDPVVERIPYVRHDDSIRYVLAADVLLLIIDQVPGGEGIMTGKIFEYLRSNKPILALVPSNGVAAEVIRETNAGITPEPDSVEAIKTAIWQLFQDFQAQQLQKKYMRLGIEKFTRRNLTEMLAIEFNQLLSK